jgi:hypothetical protein
MEVIEVLNPYSVSPLSDTRCSECSRTKCNTNIPFYSNNIIHVNRAFPKLLASRLHDE